MALIDEDPLFTSLCSSKTVQSDESGFFFNFYCTVEEKFPSKSWLKDFYSRLPNDKEKLRILYTEPNISDAVLGTLEHVKPVFRAKDAKFSLHRREEAHELMQQGKLQQALILASQAIVRAPKKNEVMTVDHGLSLAFAFWIRGEVFIEMLDGAKALRDFQLSAKYGVPASQNPKYYMRLAKCYKLLGDDKKLQVTLNVFKNLNTGGSFDEQKLNEELKDLEVRMQKGVNFPFLQELNIKKPSLYGKPHETMPSVCDALKLQDSGDKRIGKYFTAQKHVPTGETVLVEKTFAACLYPRNNGSHCNLCFSPIIAGIACLDCAGLAFCSPECRDIACDTYHKYECEYLNLMIGSGMSILCFIALRIVTSCKTPDAALAKGKQLLDILCSHSDIREPEDYFQRALMVTFLLRVLQKSGFFGRRPTEAAEPTEKELEIGALLLGLLQTLQFNAHEIYGTKLSGKHRVNGSKVQNLGVGIYKTASMFNHECYPVLTRYFQGTDIVLTTTRPLLVGQMASECYGPLFTMVPLKDRQRHLRSRYWFKCECKVCKEDWPIIKGLNNYARLKCPIPTCEHYIKYPKDVNRPIKCPMCKNTVDIKVQIDIMRKCELLYQEGACLIEANKLSDAKERLALGINMFHKIASPPHRDTHIAQESLRTCLADNGNTWHTM